MNLADYFRILRKRWMLVTLGTLMGAAVALAVTLLTTPTYRAGTQLFVSARSQDGLTGFLQGAQFTQQRVKSYADMVGSPTVAAEVIKRLELPLTPEQLAGRIDATAPLDTVLLNITASDPSPERARDIAQAVTEEFAEMVPSLESVAKGQDSPVKVTIVKAAELPEAPSSPRGKVNVALGLLAGLAIGLGLAVLREVLDTTVKGIEGVRRLTGASPLAVIGHDPEMPRRPLVVHRDAHSPQAEAFRQLRTNFQFVDIDNPPRSVVVTSATESEGKSTTAVNLAITLAQAGQRVILVEGDLRRPRIADYLGVEGAVGLTSVLAGMCTLDEALQPWGRNLMWVLSSGPLPPNPSELLGSRHVRDLMKEMLARATVVVVDAPPLLPVTDAAVLARVCDGAILVIRHGRVAQDKVSRAIESLSAIEARLLGFVLNDAPSEKADNYPYSYADERGVRRSSEVVLTPDPDPAVAESLVEKPVANHHSTGM